MGGGNPNVFDQASNAYGGGVSNMRVSALQSPYERQGAGMITSAAGDPAYDMGVNQLSSPQAGGFGTGQAIQGLRQRPGASNAAAYGYMNSVGNPAVQRTMNQYLNPYQNQVLDNMITRMRDRRADDLSGVRAQAAQAGAYGGARQGLVEAELMDRYAQAENEAISGVLQQGFNTAAQLGQGQQGIEQNAAAGLAGIGAQDIGRFAQQGQLGLGVSGQNIQQGNALVNAGLASADQRLAAANALAALGGNIANRQLGAGAQMVNAGQIGQKIGMNALEAQQQAGMQQQMLNQQLLQQAAGQYDAYINYPQTALSTAMAGVYGNPLQNAGTTTGTQTTTPGLFDWMSLVAGLGSAYMRGPMSR